MPRANAITVVYFGGNADDHRLDLYDASASYYGLARTLAILGHYYVKGEIIAHAPKSAMHLFITPPEEGSFKQVILAAAVAGIVGAPFTVFAERVINSWLPEPQPELQQIVRLLKEQNELLRRQEHKLAIPNTAEEKQLREIEQCLASKQEDLQTLRSITTKSFRDIYRPVGRSVDSVGIVAGGGRAPSKVVDVQSLALIEADAVDENDKIFLGVVNSFSRGSKTGILFSKDFERGFRFEYQQKGKLSRGDDFSWSQLTGKPLRFYGRFVRFFDGNIKKFLAFKVEQVKDAAEVDAYFSDDREVLVP